VESKVTIPRFSVLEVQLIINNQLYEDGVISEVQYHEVSKIIYEKINKLKTQN